MSSNFQSIEQLTAAFNLSVDGPFTELAKYRARNAATDGSEDRSIYVSIDRSPPATPAELKAGLTPACTIEVQNSLTAGIATSELDVGGDKLLIKYRLGDSDWTAILLPEPAGQSAGSVFFRIGRPA